MGALIRLLTSLLVAYALPAGIAIAADINAGGGNVVDIGSGGIGVGSGVATGYYGDNTNLSLRPPTATGSIFFQSPGGASEWAQFTASLAILAGSETVSGPNLTLSGVVNSGYTDLFDNPPSTGVYLATAPTLSVTSLAGHVPGDTLRAMAFFTTTSILGPTAQEAPVFVNLVNTTGAVKAYAYSTQYNVNDFVHSPDGSQTYIVTGAGTSAASGPGPTFCPTSAPGSQCSPGETNASTGQDGTVSLQWYTAGINDGKSGILDSVVITGSGGHSWGNATDVVVDSLPTPGGFVVNHEMDLTNNVRDCPPGVQGACNIYGLFISGGTNFENTVGIFGSGGSSSNAPAQFHWGVYLAPKFASDVGLIEGTGAATGTLENNSNAQYSLDNEATAPIGHHFGGTYATAAIDTVNAKTGSSGIIERHALNQKTCYNSDDWCFVASTGYMNFQIAGTINWFIDSAGGQHADGLFDSSTTPSTSTTTGALVVAGGAGIAGAINATALNLNGGNITGVGAGNVGIGNGVATGYYADTANLSLRPPSSTGSVFIQAPSGSAEWAQISATSLYVSLGTASTSDTTGALTVAGGAGFGGNMFVGGVVNASAGFSSGSANGVTCNAPPTSAFATVNGIVTHC